MSLAFVFISETLMPVVVTSDGLPGGSSGEVGSWPNDSPSSHTQRHTHTHTQLNVGQLLSSAVCKRVTRLSRLLSANRGYLPVTSQSTVCPHPTPLQLAARKLVALPAGDSSYTHLLKCNGAYWTCAIKTNT